MAVTLTYIDADKDAPTVIKYGAVLKDGESVEIPDADAEAYKNHRWFTVAEAAPLRHEAARHEPEHAAAKQPAVRK